MNRKNAYFLLCLVALALSASFAEAAIIAVRVDQDTYIRTDNSLQNSINNGDTDNELLLGRNNNITDAMRPLLGFDVSAITTAVNTTGGGNFANLTINSATLTIYERRSFAADATVDVYSYDFSFTDSAATWNDPSSGTPVDATDGGTLGTLLADNFALAWATAGDDNDQSTITLSTSGFVTALQNSNVSGTLNLILRGDTGYNTNPEFFSITSDLSGTTTRHALLSVDYSVIPEPSTYALLALGLVALVFLRRSSRAKA